jgi:hypothetical protein
LGWPSQDFAWLAKAVISYYLSKDTELYKQILAIQHTFIWLKRTIVDNACRIALQLIEPTLAKLRIRKHTLFKRYIMVLTCGGKRLKYRDWNSSVIGKFLRLIDELLPLKNLFDHTVR